LRSALAVAVAAMTLLTACQATSAPTVGPTTITVAAASDLRFALDEVIDTYRSRQADVDVVPTYGSSGNFYAQIENGAPFDIYFSADIDYPRRLESAGLAEAESTRLYTVGRIVVWVRNASPIDVEGLGMGALTDPDVRTISIANPEHAPYGRAAVAAMRTYGIYDVVEPRLVLGENVSQAAQFVESGAADIGIIAYSLALAPTIASEGRFSLIPDDLHPAIEQGVVVLDRAADPTAAARFLDFVLGPDGRAILERYGFVVPGG
jgi:molybdate transport system substrate-binding protein